MLIFVLRKVTLPNRINSAPWMNAVTPTPCHECTFVQKIFWLNGMKVTVGVDKLCALMVRSWCDRMHSWYGVDVTACIHGTELMRWHAAGVILQSHSMYSVYTVQCTLHSSNSFGGFWHNVKNLPNSICKEHNPDYWLAKWGPPCQNPPKSLYGVDAIWYKVTLRSQKNQDTVTLTSQIDFRSY